jgi:uncharacterized protein YciI
MLFKIEAIFKAGAEQEVQNHFDEFNERLGESSSGVRLAGALRAADGRRIGYLALIEAETFEMARKWLHESPIYKADLYDRVEAYEYEIEIGHLTD